jgi:hypothetical protein
MVISLKATLTEPWLKTQGPAKDVGGPGEKDGQTIEEKQRSGCMEAGGLVPGGDCLEAIG